MTFQGWLWPHLHPSSVLRQDGYSAGHHHPVQVAQRVMPGVRRRGLLLAASWTRWEPGEHNGTFEANNLAFRYCCCGMEHFLDDGWNSSKSVRPRQGMVKERMQKKIVARHGRIRCSFKGFAWHDGWISVAPNGEIASAIARKPSRHGLGDRDGRGQS